MDSCDIVSVIIPVYNPGLVLKRCLKSVIDQSYQSLEIIIVNDGSTDGSDEICRSYTEIDKRIKYICQPNTGVSASRNKGLAIAKGKYICFIDSDDYVDSDYVSSMVDEIKRTAADIVIQGLKVFVNNKLSKEERFESKFSYVDGLSDELFDKIFYFAGPYCKLFKSSIIRDFGISFPTDMSYGEDALFYYQYLEHCRSIRLIPNTSYCYQAFNQEALSSKSLSPDKFWQNQHNRRGHYRKMKEIFGLPSTITQTEQYCKIIGVGGMLNSIVKSGADDSAIKYYLTLMSEDPEFCLAELMPHNIYHRFILFLVRSNNGLSRWMIKRLYR